jgi:Fusaric acid resistance protein-like
MRPAPQSIADAQSEPHPPSPPPLHDSPEMKTRIAETVLAWLERLDPGAHRRIKGLRLVTAFGIAWMASTMPGIALRSPSGSYLGAVAAGFALWASVSENRATRAESSRDLLILVLAAIAGATTTIGLTVMLPATIRTASELSLVVGAFCVGYLRRFGVLGTGIGSQIFIGQLLAYGYGLTASDLGMVGVAGAIAVMSAIVPRVLSGPAEHPIIAPVTPVAAELRMGLQAGAAALAIVTVNLGIGLEHSAWAVTASTYTISGSLEGTTQRVMRRIVGTSIGVPLALACLPIAADAPLVIWAAAGLAVIVYAMALPERYDVACGAYAFALVVTLAATGGYTTGMLLSRAWETLLGGVFGFLAAHVLWPIRQGAARPQ